MVDSRAKGKRGEREVAAMLRACVLEAFGEQAVEGEDYEIERNLSQARAGGYDVQGIPWMACEVKNHATVTPASVKAWWAQTLRQTGPGQLPVLFYKQGGKWIVRTVLSVTCSRVERRAYMAGDVSAEDFMRYVVLRLRAEHA